MATLAYATTGTGPSAGGIGWINFGTGFTLAPGATVTGLSVTLLDGSIMTFNISNTTNAGGGVTFSTQNPSGAFGTIGYTGISGPVILYNPTGVPGTTANTILLSNISIVDPNGFPVPNYTIILADGESTNTGEQLVFSTNGSNWSLLTTIDPGPNGPTVSGTGTQTVTLTGTVSNIYVASNVFTTQNATQVSARVNSTIGGFQGVVFGVAITKVEIDKVIASRYSATDQFNLIISGTPNDTATTTGSSTGLQPISAYVYGIPGNSYTINETMASGSYGWLSNYQPTVVWTNSTPGGTVGPNPGALGNSVTVALGDQLFATITNQLNPSPPSRGIKFI